MPVRKSEAEWKGNLKEGNGTMRSANGTFEGAYSAGSRFENLQGANPEELIGAAHAGCFSMAFANELDSAGYTPRSIRTEAQVTLDKTEEGYTITKIDLKTQVEADDIDQETFQKIAEKAKNGCPVSRALAGVDIGLNAELADS